jgi:hypothetical protein
MTASAPLRIITRITGGTVVDGVLRALEAEATRCRFRHLQTTATERGEQHPGARRSCSCSAATRQHRSRAGRRRAGLS